VLELAQALEQGQVVGVPTDTVYGLAARPDRPDAIRRIFELKGRPLDRPLPVLGADRRSLGSVALFNAVADELARRFWPGPLTLVLTRAPGFDHDLGGGAQDTVAVRVPAHPQTRWLLAAAGPLAVTSANRSGEPPEVTAEGTQRLFDVPVIDGGKAAGEPSTIVDLTGEPRVLRIGALDPAEFGLRLS
jgi:tRNA threonylcarbamoyl adenosine modification protein (Sua5/YciO/YrdC/YwlC family)